MGLASSPEANLALISTPGEYAAAEAIKAFDRSNGAEQGNVGKARGTAGEEAGNSAFGQKQGDAATRTTGSQNNAYGKAQSTEAHTTKKATLSSNAEHTKSKKHTNDLATSHHATRHAQVTPYRSQQAMVRQSGSSTSSKGKAQTAQSNKKKKSKNEGPY